MDARPASGTGTTLLTDRDFEYHYDGLDRLTEAERGIWNGAAIGSSNRGVSQKWALDMLGNWSSFSSDANKDDDYADSGEEQTRSHDSANQLNSLDPDAGGSLPSLPFAYDDSGNMLTRGTSGSSQVEYTHDAWNRLVSAQHLSTNPLVTISNPWLLTNRYNGLHWRVASTESSLGSAGTIDRAKTMVYSASWQLLQEEIDINPSTSAGTDRMSQTLWGARYIDDAVLRRVDTNLDGTEDDRFYYVTDAQFSVRALLDDASPPNVVERVRYTAYGEARHGWRGDVNGDGATTLTDRNFIGSRISQSIGGTNYNPDCDMDRSGTIDWTDYNLWLSDGFLSALPPGWISAPAGTDSRVGYCGYLFNDAGALYTVRFRHYQPDIGRWLERDPAEYINGVHLSQYVMSNPVRWNDTAGLAAGDTEEDWDDYIDDLLSGRPGLSPADKKKIRNYTQRGCVGITCVMIGRLESNLSFSDCFASLAEAQARQCEMEAAGGCAGGTGPDGKGSRAVIFSKQFNVVEGKPIPQPGSGRVDMEQYRDRAGGWVYPGGGFNFDYAYWDSARGVWIGANQHQTPQVKMKVKETAAFNNGFDAQVFCVTCSGSDFGSAAPPPPAGSGPAMPEPKEPRYPFRALW